MKNQNHHKRETAEIHSKRSRNMCTESKCMPVSRLFRKGKIHIKNSGKLKSYSVIAALLGWLGAVNAIFLGAYVVTTCLALGKFQRTELILQAYGAGVVTIFSSVILIIGSYVLWQGYMRRGGVINLAAGTALVLVYVYFAFFSQPPLLSWLGFQGCFLLAPPVLSAGIGLVTRETALLQETNS